MDWLAIPSYLPRWLRQHPHLLTSALANVNAIRRLTSTRRRAGIGALVAILLLSGLTIALLISDRKATWAVQSALNNGGIIITASGLCALWLVLWLKREVGITIARSWLSGTPSVDAHSSKTSGVLLVVALAWRYSIVLAGFFLLSLSSVTFQQSWQLAMLVTIGSCVGGLCAWVISRRQPKHRREGSRYVPKPTRASHFAPSSVPLSRLPITHAFAWGRPENMRFLVGAAVLAVPGGAGVLGPLFTLAAWGGVSYLIAVLVAVPYVARRASEWLRSTPMSFWQFAWPLSRRALAHQLCGTLIGIAVFLMLGSSLLTPVYIGALWMTVVVTTAAISLADSYRAKSPAMKTSVSIVSALVVEERAHGWGISLALVIAALHLRAGAAHARA